MKEPTLSAKRILVVEDEPAIRQVCTRALTAAGFEVDIAANGGAAQDMLEEKSYHICLIDIRTPIKDGKQLYQVIISKHPKLANGVIFTTGDMLDTYTQRFLEIAGRPFLSKPFAPDELVGIVSRTARQVEK